MATDPITRRHVLKSGAASVLALSVSHQAHAETPLFAGCRRAKDGTHHASIFTGTGNAVSDVTLPGRGHGLCWVPESRKVLAFARRPGDTLTSFNTDNDATPTHLTANPEQHFYGHGCLNESGTRLYTTENEIETGEGILCVRDADHPGTIIETFRLGGIGPHEIIPLKGTGTIAIAIGGIRTHPDQGRTKLNLDTMAPALVFLNTNTSEVTDRLTLPPALHQLSIRHLAPLPGGAVACALQYEGPKSNPMPLLAIGHPSTGLRLVEAPEEVRRATRNYAGSIAVDDSGSLIAMSHPRSHMVTFWRASDAAYLGSQAHPDACGLAPAPEPGKFIVTGNAGRIALISLQEKVDLTVSPAFQDSDWDNHLIRLA